MRLRARRPTGTGEFMDWCREIHDAIQAYVPLRSKGTKQKQTPYGTFTEAETKSGVGGTTEGQFWL